MTLYHINILQPLDSSENPEEVLHKNPSLIVDNSTSPPKLRDLEINHSADLALALRKCETPRGQSEKKKKMNIPTIGSILYEEDKDEGYKSQHHSY